jgi:hypothetical protein
MVKQLILKGGSSSVAERQLPKLNVAGSIPVSRSIKSTVYAETTNSLLHSCSVYFQRRANLLETSDLSDAQPAPFNHNGVPRDKAAQIRLLLGF